MRKSAAILIAATLLTLPGPGSAVAAPDPSGVAAAPHTLTVAVPGDNYAPDDVFTSARTQWWRDTRFGMFIHFGLYSAFRGEYTANGSTCRDAEWIKRNCNIPWPVYEGRAARFNPSSFDANAVVSTAKAAGQKYIVITSKHHDGFAMWPTAVNNWNIRSRTPFQRDLLRELADAARAQLWSDGNWDQPSNAQRGADLEAYARSLSPNTIVNNRVGLRRAV